MKRRLIFLVALLVLVSTAEVCPPKPPVEKVWVSVCNSFPDTPGSEARIANEFCPGRHDAQYVKGTEPTVVCTTHVKPPEPVVPQTKNPWPETKKLLIWSGALLCDVSSVYEGGFTKPAQVALYDGMAEDGVNAVRSFAFFLDETAEWHSWKPIDDEYDDVLIERLGWLRERKLTAIVSLEPYGGTATDSELEYVIDLAKPFLPYVIFEPANEAYGMSRQTKIVNMLKAKGIPNSAIMVSFVDSGEFADMLVNGLNAEGLGCGHGVGSMETINAPWPNGWSTSSGTLALMKVGMFGSNDGDDAQKAALGLYWFWMPAGPGRRSSTDQIYEITKWMLENGRGWEHLSAAGFQNGGSPNLKDALEIGRPERLAMARAYNDTVH